MGTFTPVELVEHGVDRFASGLRTQVADEHPYVRAAMDSYLNILQCGGKRTRGTLTLHGHRLFGGNDTEVMEAAAGAVEGLHAYLLVVDDVADNAHTRRGRPAAHKAIQSFLEQQGAAGNVKQTAQDLAISAALVAQHHAQDVFANLDVPFDRRLATISSLNRHLARTSVGQVLDMASTTGMPMSEEDITTVARYKTAYYSFQLPLEAGALLAGADQTALEPLIRYSHHAGFAFQLRDDILGVFGDEATMGKSPMSDLKEGKQTFLVNHALVHADPDQQAFLRHSLGNSELTVDDFAACQAIVAGSGSLAMVEDRAAREAQLAQAVLADCPAEWPREQLTYLSELASFTVSRSA